MPAGDAMSGDSLMAKQLSFQIADGGSIPTSPLQLFIKMIGKETASIAYQRWHYLGGKDFLATYNFGVYWDGNLVGAISYGVVSALSINEIYNKETQVFFMELTRFALSEVCPKNSESRVIAITLKMIKRAEPELRGIITYADCHQGHKGTIYRATGFKYYGMTSPRKDFYVNSKKQSRGKTKGINGRWVLRTRKHLFVKYFC